MAGNPPSERCQSQGLPSEVWGQDQEPRDVIPAANLATQGAVEIAIVNTTIDTKHGLSNVIYDDRHDHQAKKKKS